MRRLGWGRAAANEKWDGKGKGLVGIGYNPARA